MLVRLVVLTALLVAASALPASADVFAPGVVVPGVLGGGAGPNQNGVVVADFDGDGRDDLAVADPTRGGVRVLRSRGDGTFFPGERGAAGFQPYALGAIELDPTTPGRELVVSSLVPSDIRVLARRPDGRWEPRQRLTVATGPFDLAVGDIDGDDLADVVALGVGGSVDLLLQRSGRLVPSVRQHIVARPYTISLGVAIADLDDDGDADIASADWLAGPLKSEIRTLLGDGKGGFTRGPSRSFLGVAEALRVADVTCDGSPDVVVSGIEGSLMVGGRGGDGSVLGSLVRKGNVPGSNAATFGDIDRDGRLDAVVSNFFGTAQITRDVCRNGFAVQQRIRTIFASETTALVDLTGDGYPELVAVGWFSTGIAVARNLGAVAG